MLRKKYDIQRNIKVDAQLSEDLDRLSKILERPQTELINLAIENLLTENCAWLKSYIIVDALEPTLHQGCESSSFDAEGVHVELNWSDDEEHFKITYEYRDNSKIIDQAKWEYEDNALEQEKMMDKLIELAMYVDYNTQAVDTYIKNRISYR